MDESLTISAISKIFSVLCIGRLSHTLKDRKSTHPWVNDRVLELVRKKRMKVGTQEAKAASQECSRGIKEEYEKYIKREKTN